MRGGLQNSRWATGGPSNRSSSVPAATSHHSSQWGSQWTTETRSYSTTTSSSYQPTERPQNSTSSNGLNAAPIRIQPSTATGELRRFMKLARRMRWKLPFLADGYRQATAAVPSTIDPAEAELHFKLDFFEFYMLCERALVHLQAVFGITISRGQQNGGRDGFVSEHRYHANVLEALDREENPLHGALGSGVVRQQLARAKDLRNRWKNADNDPERPDMPPPPPLDTYDLDRILAAIFAGFDAAYVVAEGYVADLCAAHAMELQRPGAGNGQQANSLADMMVFEQGDFDFIEGAMDWEAV